MNKNQYRIIFNAHRGVRMAVAETAVSQGKRASGESAGPTAAGFGRAVFNLTMGASLVILCGLLSPNVDAQIVADRTAPGNRQPTVLQTASGLPQVNIQTPSAAGVSRNTYSQFDVSNKGVILNNSRTDTNTQIGGLVQGNPWLATGSARVILNEVNASNASQLNGYIEVAGQRAEVIIANPAGIAVNGGGFLNAGSVTLTTGTAVMNAGNLDSFQVRNGTVSVHGAGLDTSTADYTNILSRAALVNAGIWAKDLKLITGANDINVSNFAAPSVSSTLAASGVAPSFSLDVAVIGGMYAGQIFLVGTEAGLGIRNGGTIGATVGDVVLTNNGWLSNSGEIYAMGNTSIASQGDLTNTGSMAALGNTSLSAQGLNTQGAASQIGSSTASVIAAGLDANGHIAGAGTVTLASSGSAGINGQIASGADTNIAASAIDLSHATLSAANAGLVASAGGINASQSVLGVQGTLVATTLQTLRTDGAKVSANQLTLAARALSNVAGALTQTGTGDAQLEFSGDLNNTQGQIATNSQNLSLAAATLTNAAGKIEHAGTGTLSVTAGTLSGQGGSIVSNGALTLSANTIGLQSATTTATSIAITGTSLDNTSGKLQSTGGDLNVKIGALGNTLGSLYSSANLGVHAQSVTNSGSIYATGNADISATGGITNSGSIAALGNSSIQAESVNSTSASLLAAGIQSDGKVSTTSLKNLQVTTTGSTSALGQNLASQDISFSASSLDLSQSQTGAANISLQAQAGDISTRSASIVTPGTLSVQAQANGAQTWNNSAVSAGATAGVVQAKQLQVNIANLDNQGGTIIQSGAGDTTIALTSASGTLNNAQGRIATNSQNLSLTAASINNAAGKIEHAGGGTLAIAASNLNGSSGTIVGNGLLNLQGGALDLSGGTTNAQHIEIAAASLNNAGGQIVQLATAGATADIAVTGAVDNTAGTIASNAGLSIQAASLNNAAGQIVQSAAAGTTAASVEVTGAVDNTAGAIASNVGLRLTAASLNNHGGQIVQSGSTGQTTVVVTSSIDNTLGTIASNAALALQSASLTNTSGKLQSTGGHLTVQTGSLTNTAGSLYSSANLGVQADNVTNSGSVYAAGNTDVRATGSVTNSGSMAALGNTSIQAQSVNSTSASLLAAGIQSDGIVSTTSRKNLQVTSTGSTSALGQNLAAQDISFTASSLDLSQSQTNAANISLQAQTGDISTRGATVVTPGSLSVQAQANGAQTWNNSAVSGAATPGTVQANQLQVNVANLNNQGGVMIQSGAGDTTIALTSASGTLNNAQGRIATNSQNLNLTAATINNAAGKIEHAGSGTLAIAASNLNGSGGTLVGNGMLNLQGGALDLRGGTTHAQHIEIAAASLNNAGGQIVQLATTGAEAGIAVTGSVDNFAGTIASNSGLHLDAGSLDNTSGNILQAASAGSAIVAVAGVLTNATGKIASNAGLSLQAASLNNAAGQIVQSGANGQASVVVTSNIENTLGTIASNAALALQSGSLTNTSGKLQSTGGDLTVQTGSLTNTAGSLHSSANLGVQAESVTNSGSVYAAGNTDVRAIGSVTNSGSIAALGSTSIQAQSVNSNSASLLAAGIQSDGKVSTTSRKNLQVTATGSISALGQNLASQDISFTAASIDLSQSQTGAANITLRAQTGDISTRSATVVTPGSLSVQAQANGAQTWNNSVVSGAATPGTVQANQLQVNVANLNNQGGVMIQSGAGDTTIALTSASGTLNNAQGRIATNSQNLNLTAATINNANGKIEHAGSGTLAIVTSNLNGSGGTLVGDGLLNLQGGALDLRGGTTHAQHIEIAAASLNNAGGQIVQLATTGAAAGIAVTGSLDNSAGTIASNSGLHLDAGSLGNHAGRIVQSAMTGDARVRVTGNLDNTQGAIASNAGLSIQAASLNNAAGQIVQSAAAGTTAASVEVTGAVDNTAGAIASNVGLDVKATSLNNHGGQMVQSGSTGQTTVVVTRALDNTQGTIASNAGLRVQAATLHNAAGQIVQTAIAPASASAARVAVATLDNASGTIASNAGLQVQAITLDNTSGKIIQSVAASALGSVTAATLEVTGALNNTAGTIASNVGWGITAASLNNHSGQIADSSTTGAASLGISGALNNTQGTIASNAGLQIETDSLINTSGNILQAASTGSANLVVSGELTNASGTIASNAGLRVQAASLNNAAGQIVQSAASGTTAASVEVAGAVDNTTGKIASNVGLAVTAASLNNHTGQIVQSGASGQASVVIENTIDNTQGTIASNAGLRVQAATLHNAAGQIVQTAIAPSSVSAATVAAATLDNALGTIASNAGLQVQAITLDNTSGKIIQSVASSALGSVAAASVDVTGALNNTAGTIASNVGLGIAAASLNNHAGQITDSSTTGAASLGISGALDNSQGTIASNAGMQLQADSLDNTSGNILQAATTGTATVTVAKVLTNATGKIASNAGLSIQAASLNNHAGQIVQSGANGQASVVIANTLDNTQGTIASKAGLRVQAATLHNAAGQIVQAAIAPSSVSAARVAVATLDNASGTIASNAGLQVQATSLNNASGKIIQSVAASALGSVAAATLDVTGALNNTAGTIASNVGLGIAAASLNNHSGQITDSSTTGAASLGIYGALDNTQGTIASNAGMQLQADSLDNTSGNILQSASTGSASIAVAGVLTNAAGTVASNAGLRIQAASLNNAGGRVMQSAASGATAASVVATGAIDNTAGTIASNVQLDIQTGSLDNRGGKLTASTALTVGSAGAVNNSASGLIAANGDVTVNAQSLDNTDAAMLSVQGALKVITTALTTNVRGQMQSGADMALQSAGLDNTSGLIQSGGLLGITSGAANNQSGKLLAIGDLSITGNLDNTAGLVRTLGTLQITGDQVINRTTLAVAANGQPTDQGLEGRDILIAAKTIDNTVGAIRADHDLTMRSAQTLDNSQGLINAGNALRIKDSASAVAATAVRALMVSNTGGVLNAGGSNSVAAQGIRGAGRILSQGSLSLDLSSDYHNTGDLIANGDLSLATTGDVTNIAKLQAGQTLTLSAANISNFATGQIAGNTSKVTASNTLTNRGLIDGVNTQINAVTLNNIGTGKIYGDTISIAAGTVHNDAEAVAGVTTAATIAARQNLDMGVATLNNQNGASIFSVGDTRIGGALDAARKATGFASTVTNSASTIEALGAISINTATLQNLNPTFSYRVVSGTPSAERTEYILSNGNTVQEAQVAVDNGKLQGYSRAGGDTSPYGQVLLASDPLATTTNVTIYRTANTASSTEVLIGYTPHDHDPVYETRISVFAPQDTQLWALVGLTVPGNPPPTGPRPPATIPTSDRSGPAHNPAVDDWDAAAAPYLALQSRIDAKRAQMDAHMLTVQAYNVYTSTTEQAVVNGGTPGTIRSGGNITINASNSARNDNSRIMAGGALSVNVPGGQLDNTSTTADVQTLKAGYNFSWGCVNFRGTSSCGVAYYNQGNIASQPELRQNPFTQNVPTTVQVSNSSAVQYTAASIGQKGSSAATTTDTVTGVGGTGQLSIRSGSAVQASTGQNAVAENTAAGAALQSSTGQGALGANSGTTLALPASSGPGAQSATPGVSTATQTSTTSNPQDLRNGLSASVQGSGQGSQSANAAVSTAVLSGSQNAQRAQSGVSASVGEGLPTLPARAEHSALGGANAVTGSTAGAAAQSGLNAIPNGNSMAPGSANAGVATGSAATPNRLKGFTSIQTPFKVPSSSLFNINRNPASSALVETDPRFTNSQAWLSSDYITQQISLDPSVTQKRLGDGFYEQQLIREQVSSLTGKRFLGNYSSDDQQYHALMDSGLTFAKAQNLRPGIALSAAQIAALTTDIAWLQQEDVTLPDGSVTKALVPHVYAAIRDGDLSPTGALLSGDSVAINTGGDLTNSGSIMGRKVVQLGANNLNNLGGQIGAQDVALKAVQDINNIGGSIGGVNSVAAVAGGDINVTSTNQSSAGNAGGYSFSQSGIDRVATMYVSGPGTLLASAGNNINLTAAQLSSGGVVQIQAANNLTLSTITSSRSDNFGAGNADNHFLSGSSKELGVTIQSVGATTLAAGNTLSATAAQVNATGDLSLSAKNIALLAGTARANSDSVMTNSSSGFLSSSTTVTRESNASASAQVNSLTGNNVSINAGQDLVSVGSKFAAQETLTVVGKNSQSFFAAQDTAQSNKSVESSSSMFGGALSTGNSSSSDTRAKSMAIASELTSTKAINVQVGNSATFEGAKLTAEQIAFVNLDPSKSGSLILNGSTNTTQTSHSEKSETLGVYQEAKGQGSTVQTLNQTQLRGNVSFDAGLKITAQIPKDVQQTQGGQALAKQVQTLQGTLGASQTGLAYLNQLAANPNVKWDKVALANEKWSYDQAGLTPAGAALLSIAIAASTGGMGAGMLGGTSATAATATTAASAATLAGSASLATAVNTGFASLAAQAAVAMVNNGGDIGKTLAQLGSEQSIKGLLTTMATAGALQSLDKALGFDSTQTATGQTGSAVTGVNGVATSQAANAFQQNLLKNITNNVAGAAINSAINGKPFDESTLSSALSSALVTAGMAAGANAIGDAATGKNGNPAQIDAFTQKLAHAVLGCAGGAVIAGNGSGCSAGGVGAVVGELTAQYADQTGLSDQNLLGLAKVVAAAAGVLVGGGDAATAVNIAATAGENAAENNFLFSKNLRELRKVAAACDKNQSASNCNRKEVLELRDKTLDVLQEKYSKAGPTANMKQLIGKVSNVYQDEFDKYAVDAKSFLLTMASIESSFNPTVTNAAGYQGLYQFSSDNAMNKYSIGNPDPSIRLDPTWATAAGAQFGLDNANYLSGKGVAVTEASLYLAHQQGYGGAAALLKNPDTKASEVLMSLTPSLSKEVAEKRIVQNGGSANMTASDFVKMWSDKYEAKRKEAIK